MPLTPLHLGPALLLGLLAFEYLDLTALLVSTVIIDIEPLLNMLRSRPVWHGFFHSFLGGTIAGIFMLLLFPLRDIGFKLTDKFGVGQKSSSKEVIIGSLAGFYLHIFLDSFLYQDIKPFYPLYKNPFYGKASFFTIYLLCSVSFAFAFLVYLRHNKRKGKDIK